MKTYEEWVATRFVKDRVFSDEIANIIRDGPLRLPERKGWQIYMTPQMQNFRELAHMKTADEGKANQRLLREEIDDVKRNNDPGPAVDIGFVAEATSSQNGAAPAMQQFMEGLARSHQAYVDGVDRRSREELDRLAQEIRASHERERIASEISASRFDALHADRVRMEGLVAQATQAMGAPAPTVDLSTTNQHMASMEAALNRQQESFKAAAAEMMRENREFFGRIAAQQGLTAAQVQEMLERRLAGVQPTVVDARTVNIDARTTDARTVNQDSRTVIIHQVDNRSVAQVVNVSGGPPPPPPGAGAIRNGPTGPLPNQRWTPYAKAPAVADQLAITAGPPPPPPPPPVVPVPSVPRARSEPQGRALADLPRARTRSPVARATATKEAKEAARQAKAAEKERERAAKAAERERLKELKKIAREGLVRDARRKQQKRPQVFDISGQDVPAPRDPDQWLEPEEAAAAAEAAVKRRKGAPKAQARPKAKAQPKARPKAQSKSPAIRRVPVERERSPKRAGPKRAPRRNRGAAGQVAGAENILAQ
jgi:hypothetical protein